MLHAVESSPKNLSAWKRSPGNDLLSARALHLGLQHVPDDQTARSARVSDARRFQTVLPTNARRCVLRAALSSLRSFLASDSASAGAATTEGKDNAAAGDKLADSHYQFELTGVLNHTGGSPPAGCVTH